MTTKKLIRHQACWTQFLLEFNLIISYIMSKDNTKTDILTCHFNNSLANNYNNQ